MKDKVLKYAEFLIENAIPSKGEIDNVLRNLETKLRELFGEDQKDKDKVVKFKEKPQNDSFESLGAQLQSLELSKYTKLTHTLTLKFSCEDESGSFLYNFLFSINLEKLKKAKGAQGAQTPPAQGAQAPAQGAQAPAQGAQGAQKTEGGEIPIEICKVEVKKYDEEDFALLGQIEREEVEIKKIDGKFLLEMKEEIDEKTKSEKDEDSEDEFEIVLK